MRPVHTVEIEDNFYQEKLNDFIFIVLEHYTCEFQMEFSSDSILSG